MVKQLGHAKIWREEGSNVCWCLFGLSFDPDVETCSSEMSVDFQRATWRYIPEDRTLSSFCFLAKTIQIKIYKPVVLLQILYL
jgi:hypothetical protein